jgi:hypothetical protein
MQLFNKKAEAAAIGVLIIGVLIVGYLMMMPRDDKCKVMPDLPECKGESSSSTTADILLNEQPGFLQPLEDSVEHDIGSIDLFTRETTEIPFTISTDPSVERSWFNSKKITQEFDIPGRAKKVLLFVGITEAEGFASLGVVINGKTVARVVGAGQHIIEIPSDVLKTSNTLEIVPSTPLIPTITNVFKINYLSLKETYTTTQPQIQRAFKIDQNVHDIISAMLSFTADCYSQDNLKLKINNDTVVNEKICTSYTNDVTSALASNNVITFESGGNYFLHNVKLKIKFKQKDYVTYYFTINKETFERIDNGEVLAMLKLRFPDVDHKETTIYVNGHPVNIDTSNIEYKTAVGRLLLHGQNSLRIVPETKVSIGSVSIELE